MADTKNTNDIKIIVITCEKHVDLLPEFSKRFSKYWGDSFFVFISNTPLEKWSDGVINLLESLQDKYVILLHEDFYLTVPIDKDLLNNLKKFALEHKVDRVSLCGNHTPDRTYKYLEGFYRHYSQADYQLSFEASIFRRKWLLEILKRGLNPWESEGNYRFELDSMIISSGKAPVVYKDRLRKGKLQEV